MTMQKNYYAVIPANVRYDKDLSANSKLLYGEITALTNEKGFCWATNAYFAELYNVTKRSIQMWISQLAEKGFIYVEIIGQTGTKEVTRKIHLTSSHEERFTTPRKNLHPPHEIDCTTPHEENFVENNTVINNTINNTSNIKKLNKKAQKNSSSAELESEFELLWAKYPRKIGKAKALQSYIKARKVKKYTFETIEIGLNKYVEYIETQGTDEQFIQHGSTWFHQEKWLDDYICTATKKKPSNVFDFMRNEYGGDNFERTGNGNIIDYDTTDIPKFF